MALATAAQLASYLQVAEVDTYTAELVLDFATSAIRNVARDQTLDTPTAPADLTRICLQAAARGYRNPTGLRSSQRAVDDYSETDTYATETLASVELTEQERADVLIAVGSSSGFTIRPLYIDPSTDTWVVT